MVFCAEWFGSLPRKAHLLCIGPVCVCICVCMCVYECDGARDGDGDERLGNEMVTCKYCWLKGRITQCSNFYNG